MADSSGGSSRESKRARISKYTLIALGLIAGVLMLIIGTNGISLTGRATSGNSADGGGTGDGSSAEIYAYESYLEEKAKRLCESVYGVGSVSVYVRVGGGFESVWASDGEWRDGTRVENPIVVGSGSSARLCRTRIDAPEIVGIGVCCRGGENEAIRNELITLLSAAFGVGSNKIHVSAAP